MLMHPDALGRILSRHTALLVFDVDRLKASIIRPVVAKERKQFLRRGRLAMYTPSSSGGGHDSCR
jgi:hypothetical protein